jgi:hypothetical protein
VLSAAPASADSNFERGFEDQMGRILAYETVNLGKHVLFQGVASSHYGHDTYRGDHYRYAYEPKRYERRHRRHHRYQDRHDRRHRKHWKRHHRGHRGHHRDCGGHY